MERFIAFLAGAFESLLYPPLTSPYGMTVEFDMVLHYTEEEYDVMLPFAIVSNGFDTVYSDDIETFDKVSWGF